MTETIAAAEKPSNELDGAPRIATLDILRGIAILGILFMNINDMGASFNYPDIRHLGWSAGDQIAWWLRQVLADGTARCLLEMLFGAGMVILTERLARGAARWSALKRYYWRNLVLALFGFVHMYILLWPGDILHTYGIAALVAFLFRNLRPRWLIALGLVGATFQAGFVGYNVAESLGIRHAAAAGEAKRAAGQPLTAADRAAIRERAKRIAERAKERTETAQKVAREDRERPASAANWISWAFRTNRERLTSGEQFSIWEAAGTMLIGAALFKLGILQGERRRAIYWRMAIAGYLLAGGWRALGAWQMTRFDNTMEWHWILDEFARIGMTLGHIGLLYLVLGSARGARWLAPFAAAGRTALSIYVLQSLVCIWVLFAPWGFGLYGKVTWLPLMLTAAAVNAGLLVLAVWWTKRFRIAPVEWAWRSLLERRRLPIRL